MTSKWKRKLKRALIEERQKLKGAAGVLDDSAANSRSE